MLRAGSSRASRFSLRWLVASDAPAPDRPAPPLRANARPGVRGIVNFGGGIKGMEGFLKQEKLREKVEQMQDARAKAERYVSEREAKSDGSSASKPAHPPPWEAPPPPMGVHAMAEAQIERAMRAGAFDNMAGKGKPLASDPSTETPWDVDAGQAALNRVLKSAGYRPRSVEALEKLRSAAAALESVLARGVSSGSVTDLASAAGRREVSEAYREKAEATRQYNSALIVDAESYGSGWPLRPAKMATLEEHVKAETAAKR